MITLQQSSAFHYINLKKVAWWQICCGREENFVGGLTFDVLEFPAHFVDAVIAAQVNPHFNRLHLHAHPNHQSQDG